MAAIRRMFGRLSDEDGFSLLELTAALSILTFGFLALATSASVGARLLAEGKQRQAASEIASRYLEHVRNIPYDQVGLAASPTQSSDTDNPDYYVSGDGLQYDWKGAGAYEDLVIESDGHVPHTENVTVFPTQMTVYQYITWIDDPEVVGTQDYKRVTIVAFYLTPVNTGRPTSVRASALLTRGTITIGGEASDETGGSGSVPNPSPNPTSTSGSCSGDTTAPTGTFSLLSGTGADEGFTASTTVTIQIAPSDPCQPITARFSNDGLVYGDSVVYDATNPTATWTVTEGDGIKNVWVRFRDAVGNSRVVGPKTITLDQTKPTIPGALTVGVSCSGTNRTVTMAWGVSTDTNLLGYRVYRSIDGGAFTLLKVTSSLSASDTHAKTLDSVRFHIKAYDKAGNESEPTNEIALGKNQCS